MIAYNKSYTKLRGDVSAVVAFLFMVVAASVFFFSMTLILPFKKNNEKEKLKLMIMQETTQNLIAASVNIVTTNSGV